MISRRREMVTSLYLTVLRNRSALDDAVITESLPTTSLTHRIIRTCDPCVSCVGLNVYIHCILYWFFSTRMSRIAAVMFDDKHFSSTVSLSLAGSNSAISICSLSPTRIISGNENGSKRSSVRTRLMKHESSGVCTARECYRARTIRNIYCCLKRSQTVLLLPCRIKRKSWVAW